jgi:hypothetical protein
MLKAKMNFAAEKIQSEATRVHRWIDASFVQFRNEAPGQPSQNETSAIPIR